MQSTQNTQKYKSYDYTRYPSYDAWRNTNGTGYKKTNGFSDDKPSNSTTKAKTNVTDHNRTNSAIKLVFSATAWGQLNWLLNRSTNEVSALGLMKYDENDCPLYISELLIPPQECDVAYTRFDPERFEEWLHTELEVRKLTMRDVFRCWIHTHPGNSPHPSTTDEQCFRTVWGSCDYGVMFIMAQNNSTYCRLRVGEDGIWLAKEIGVEHELGPAVFDTADYEKQYSEKVKIGVTHSTGPVGFEDDPKPVQNTLKIYESDGVSAAEFVADTKIEGYGTASDKGSTLLSMDVTDILGASDEEAVAIRQYMYQCQFEKGEDAELYEDIEAALDIRDACYIIVNQTITDPESTNQDIVNWSTDFFRFYGALGQVNNAAEYEALRNKVSEELEKENSMKHVICEEYVDFLLKLLGYDVVMLDTVDRNGWTGQED